MQNIKSTVSALLCASLLTGLCSCQDKTYEAVEETTAATTEVTTEETVSEETIQETSSLASVSDESAAQMPLFSDEDEAYQLFIEGLTVSIRNGEGYYYGPVEGVEDHVDDLGIAAYYLSWSDSYYYTYSDIDNNGTHELVIGHEAYDQEDDPMIIVDGFVLADSEGGYDILIISWERSETRYLGGGYFLTAGSSGAGSHSAQICHFDGSQIITDATIYEEYEGGTDSADAEPEYTLYLGDDYSEENALYGEEAMGSWDEIFAEADSYDNELIGAEWSEVTING